MGNLLSCRTPVDNFIFLPNGKARPIENMVTVAELMLEHPNHFVAELISGKSVPLPADYRLEAKKAYVVLPMAAARSKSLPNMMKGELSDWMDDQREILLRRPYSSKGWKPSLRTIEEWSLGKKVPHWLF